jgi:hypothetical protein
VGFCRGEGNQRGDGYIAASSRAEEVRVKAVGRIGVTKKLRIIGLGAWAARPDGAALANDT